MGISAEGLSLRDLIIDLRTNYVRAGLFIFENQSDRTEPYSWWLVGKEKV